MAKKDWHTIIQPLLQKYKGRRHPLNAKSRYQLLVMVVLSAQDSDAHINAIAPAFFEKYPDMPSLAKASVQDIQLSIADVRNNSKKADWLTSISKVVKVNDKIPMTMETLTALRGIGRKSANVILRESGKPAEGIMVDLHVVRVAPRIGIVTATEPIEIEKQLMQILPEEDWDIGMAISFLGRETCRPSNPKCVECLMKENCLYLNGKGK